LESIFKSVAAVLVICVGLSGCSLMTTSGRQQMAYRHYVRKQVRQRQRALARAQKESNRHHDYTIPNEPKVSATAETVADPITVSSSTTGESDGAQAEP